MVYELRNLPVGIQSFEKIMLLSTMKAYWEGKKELFKGLKIEELEKDNPEAWQEYPVARICRKCWSEF